MADTQDLTGWLQKEQDKVTLLETDLHDKITVIPRINVAPWLRSLTDEFERFRAHVEKHIALEEEMGFWMTEAKNKARARRQRERQIAEHREISRLMTSIFRQLASLSPNTPLLIHDACCRIWNLLNIVRFHERQDRVSSCEAVRQPAGAH